MPQPFWHEALPSILAAHNGKPSAIIFLIFPAVAQGAERWSVGPSEQCEICDSFERFEHNIIGQEAKKIVDCWDMNIVKCEDCAGGQFAGQPLDAARGRSAAAAPVPAGTATTASSAT